MTWKTVPLGDEVDILSGFAWKSKQFNSNGQGLPVIRIQNVDSGPQSDFVYWSGNFRDKFLINNGDILLTLSGSFRITRWQHGQGLLNQRVVKLTPSSKLDANFFIHFMLTKLRQIEAMGKLALVNNVSITDLKKIDVPVPSLAEQRRIAAILDKADALRAKRRTALAKLDTLLQATFLDMFGDPVTNPKSWEVVDLNNVAEVVSGVTKSKSRIKGKETVTVPYMRVANVQDGKILTGEEDLKTIEVLPEDVDRYLLEEGDILLTEGGDPDKLGRGGVWKGEVETCIHQNHVFRVRVNNGDFLPEYLSALIGSQYGKLYFLKAAKQTTGIASINMTQLKGFPTLRAPMKLQQKFEDFQRKLEVQKSILELNLDQLDNLFHSLQQRAFKGEL